MDVDAQTTKAQSDYKKQNIIFAALLVRLNLIIPHTHI
jgi:hypothetical protein